MVVLSVRFLGQRAFRERKLKFSRVDIEKNSLALKNTITAGEEFYPLDRVTTVYRANEFEWSVIVDGVAEL